MVHAVDFDRRMILLTCRLAHDLDMKDLNVLKALLDTLDTREKVGDITEAMTLISSSSWRNLLPICKYDVLSADLLSWIFR
ncbi:hypothetical protein M405DRAFT_834423 [Rhizopogon salebrosus TDB-379]|nr:hypothetical protein M405DRAFT_834423 [Rhizopogon salebrosus TDB-379]